MMERPVIASCVGGLPEIIIDGKTGLLVAPEQPAALADAIIHLLSDIGRVRQMGHAARKTVLEKHTWDVVLRRIFQLADLEHLLAGACMKAGD